MKLFYPIALSLGLLSCTNNVFAQACQPLATATITILPAPVPTVQGGGDFCTPSATLSVTPPYPSYSWSSGQSSPTISVTSTGTYTVTVTNANGCTGESSTFVNFVPDLAPNISELPYACDGQLVLTADPGYVSYAWSTGQSGQNITILNTGNYSVTVTNAAGCTGSGNYFADIPADPVVSISGDNSFCTGGSASLSASGGFNTYFWSTGESGQTIDVNAGGNYTVTATNADGCTATSSQIVQSLPSPQPAIAGDTEICEGGTSSFNAGNGYIDYEWSDGQSGQTIPVVAGGTYIVTVTSANGCTGTDSETLNVLPEPQPNITAAPYACDNQLVLSAASGFVSYSWSNGPTGPVNTVTVSDNYSVTVTDAEGCTGIDVFVADIPAAPSVVISGDPDFCNGSSSILTASAGFDTYVWTGGQTGSTLTVGATGNYTVTATDFFGCTATDVLGVTALQTPQPTISGPSTICTGSTATFTVTGNFSSYLWTGGESTPSIQVNTAGDYGVTVTDNNGCTGSALQTLTLGNSLQTQIVALPYACNGQVTLDAGAGFNNYSWSNGTTNQTITVSVGGTYDVTVSDNGGCSGSATTTVTVPVLPDVTVTGDASVCQGASANLVASSGFTSYLWSNGQTGDTISVSTTDNYTVTVTDNNGCTDAASFQVNVLPQLQPQITGPTLLCPNNSGTLALSGTYSSYSWSTGETTPTISVSTAGMVGVTVTDDNGCSGTASQNITIGTNPTVQIATLPYACNGQYNLDAGSGFASYLWSDGQTLQSIAATQTTTYGVTVTNATGCTGTNSVDITIPSPPNVSVDGDDNLCQGEITTLSASSGSVSYVWSDGQTTQSINVDLNGTYTVTATDALGCTATASLAVVVNALPQVQINGPTFLCSGNSGTMSVVGSFSSYFWSTGETTPTISVNFPGPIDVTVTDANGCSGSSSQTVTVGNSPQPQIAPLPYTCNGQITLDAGAGFAAYLWTGGQTSQTIAVTQSNNYSVTVTDASGCTGTATANATVPVQPVVAISGPTVFCENESATLTATEGFVAYEWTGGPTTSNIQVVQGGVYAVTIVDALGCTATASQTMTEAPVSNVQFQQITCDPSAVGTVENTFVNQSGCDSVVTVTTVLGPSLTVTAATTTDYNGFEVACNSGSDGAAQANVAGGTTPFTYLWSQGGTTPAISNLSEGQFTVTVTDAAGCSGTAVVQLDAPEPMQATIDLTHPDCNRTGELEITSTQGGVGPYTYVLGNQTESGDGIDPVVFESLNPGIQNVLLTDANGCTLDTNATIQTFIPVQTFYTDTFDINTGETVQLILPVSFTPQSIVWTPSTGLSCTDCLDPVLTTTVSTLVSAQVDGLSGCESQGTFVVNIKKGGNVYIPNVFNPLGDYNSRFNAFGDDRVFNVKTLQVFDRWGNKIADIDNLTPNDPTQGWDGKFRGDDMQPGVYAYWMEIEFIDGTSEVFSGDVTIVR